MPNKRLLASALTLALCPLGASAESLTIASTNAEPVPLNRFVEQWAEAVTEQSDGALDITVRHGPMLANHTNFYDRVVDGVVDISLGMSVFNPGKFANSLVMTMPFAMESSEQGSLAACRMHEAGAFGDDYEGLKVLYFYQFPQAALHTTDTAIEGLQSMDGLSIIATAPPAVRIVEANGGNPLSVTITEVYEALERGTADGFINSFTTFPAFRLGDHLKHSYVAPLGGALGAQFMTMERYESLSDEARAVIDANSTCETSRQAGAFIDEWNANARALVEQGGEHAITEMSDAEIEQLKGMMFDQVKATFAATVPGGEALVETMLRQLEAAR